MRRKNSTVFMLRLARSDPRLHSWLRGLLMQVSAWSPHNPAYMAVVPVKVESVKKSLFQDSKVGS